MPVQLPRWPRVWHQPPVRAPLTQFGAARRLAWPSVQVAPLTCNAMSTSLAVLCLILLLTAYLPLGSLGLLPFACVLPGIWLLWFFDFRRRRQSNSRTTAPSVTTLGMESAHRPSTANPVAYPLGASQIPVTSCASIAEAFATPVITFKANTPTTQLPAPNAAPVPPAREQAIAGPPSHRHAPSVNPIPATTSISAIYTRLAT